MRTSTRSSRPNGHHTTHNGVGTSEATCPTCESPISLEKYADIQGKLRAHDVEVERAAATKFAVREASIRREAAAAATAAATMKLAQAERAKKAAEAKAKSATTETKRLLDQQRKQMEQATDERIAAERERHGAEKATFEAQKAMLEANLVDMQRRLSAKTNFQLSEPTEVDLYETVRTTFCGGDDNSSSDRDRAYRVPKGKPGPDVILEVVHMGAVAGTIIIDAKNYGPKRWSNKFVSKLRDDQRALGASFAILSSTVFPAGRKLLHVQDGIVIADPSLVIVVLTILRQQVIDHHRLKLSVASRKEKADELFRLILSPAWADWFAEIVKITTEMTDLEQADAISYSKTSAKRFSHIASLRAVYEAMGAAISRLINRDDAP